MEEHWTMGHEWDGDIINISSGSIYYVGESRGACDKEFWKIQIKVEAGIKHDTVSHTPHKSTSIQKKMRLTACILILLLTMLVTGHCHDCNSTTGPGVTFRPFDYHDFSAGVALGLSLTLVIALAGSVVCFCHHRRSEEQRSLLEYDQI